MAKAFKKAVKIFFLSLLITTATHAQRLADQQNLSPAQQPQKQPSQEMQKLQQEFIGLNQQLQLTQQKAYQDPEIVSETEKFTDLIDKKIIEENPAMKDLIEKRDRLIEAMEKAYKSLNQEEVRKIQQEIMQLAQALQPVLQKVMQDETIKAFEEELMVKIYEKMKVINPELEKIIARLEEIGREVQRMQ